MSKKQYSCFTTIFVILTSMLQFAGLICLLVGGISGVLTRVFNPVLLWTGFSLYIGGRFLGLFGKVAAQMEEDKNE